MSCLSRVNMSFTFDLGRENLFRSFEKQFAQRNKV